MSSSSSSSSLQALLGLRPSSPEIRRYTEHLSSFVGISGANTPQIKVYSDCVYFDYFQLGLSLQCQPESGYSPRADERLQQQKLTVDNIYLYNVRGPEPDIRIVAKSFPVSFPLECFMLALEPGEPTRSSNILVARGTTGKDFVECLGEPDRKGGGKSISIWCEWSKAGIMVEFAGTDAIGPQAWETGNNAIWGVITVFRPTSA